MKKSIFSAMALATVMTIGAQTTTNLVIENKDGSKVSIPTTEITGVMFEEAPDYTECNTLLSARYVTKESLGVYDVQFGTGPADANGDPANVGDLQVALRLVSTVSTDLDNTMIPGGYYRVGNGSQTFTFDVNNSAIWQRLSEGDDGVTPLIVMGGTVDVRVDDGGNYDIRMELSTMTAGEINLQYEGKINFKASLGDFEPLDQPVDVVFEGGQGRFYGNWFYPFACDATLQFYTGNFNENQAQVDGYWLQVPVNLPKVDDPEKFSPVLADGTYKVDFRNREEIQSYTNVPFTFDKGQMMEIMGEQYLIGSYITYLEPSGRRQRAAITGGTITVSNNGTSVVFDLTTEYGSSVKGSYGKKPNIQNFCDNGNEPQKPYSTLEGNVALDFPENTGGYLYQDMSIVEDLKTYYMIVSEPNMKKGDCLMLDFLASPNGIEDGTYNINKSLSDKSVIPGTYGSAGEGSLLFSWYGDLDSTGDDGAQSVLAPVTSGTITITTVDGGKKKLVFDMADDNGHKITGECTVTVAPGAEQSAAKRSPLKIAK